MNIKFDYYAFLCDQNDQNQSVNFDELTVSFYKLDKKEKDQKNKIRGKYIKELSDHEKYLLPDDLGLNCLPRFPLLPSWLSIEVRFTLQRPWYSRDERVFHILDNPVHKERLFGVPYIPASTWKGLMRWACRMQAGLRQHLEKHNGTLESWKDPEWIVHLFGNEKGEEEIFMRGALVFYPTWFNKISFEVINPHNRSKRAGTQPIYYEVVPANTSGVLSLLYAPMPGSPIRKDALANLLSAIHALLTYYGISAKRTAGWGTAKINNWEIAAKHHQISAGDLASLTSSIDQLVC